MDHIRGQDREQMMIMSLDQLVHKESFVRIIDAFVDALDLEEFGFLYYKLNKAGRPPFHPSTMLKLYIYGYQNGIRSCRKLEKATMINIEVMWLLKGLRPNFKTIAKFRKDNAKAFREVFRSFVSILKDWNLVDGKHIAIDSFKIRAQNSLKNNHNQRKIDRHLEYIDNKINEYFELLDDEKDPAERDLINQKIEYNAVKADQYLILSKRLEEENVDQISTVDPDAKAVLLHRNIVNVGYNVQAVSDGKNKMLVGMDTGNVNDTHALAPMIRIAQTNMGVKSMSVLADKGYHTGAQLADCESLGVKTFVSPKANAANRQYNVFPMEQFDYDLETDTYRCPNNSVLRSNGQTYQRKGPNRKGTWVPFKHYKTKDCMECSIKDQCTGSYRGRIIQRSLHQGAIDRNNARVNHDPDYYRNRQQIIEHQFGTLKRQWGFTHVLVRGKENVLGEVSIIFTAYNLRRCMSILGFEGLLKRVRALFHAFWGKLILRDRVGLYIFKFNIANRLLYDACERQLENINYTMSL